MMRPAVHLSHSPDIMTLVTFLLSHWSMKSLLHLPVVIRSSIAARVPLNIEGYAFKLLFSD